MCTNVSDAVLAPKSGQSHLLGGLLAWESWFTKVTALPRGSPHPGPVNMEGTGTETRTWPPSRTALKGHPNASNPSGVILARLLGPLCKCMTFNFILSQLFSLLSLIRVVFVSAAPERSSEYMYGEPSLTYLMPRVVVRKQIQREE